LKRFIAIWILLSAGLNVWQSIHIKKLEEKRPITVYKADNAGAEIKGRVVHKEKIGKLYTITIKNYGIFVVTQTSYENFKDWRRGEIMRPKFRAWISEADTMANDLKGIDCENETVVLRKLYYEDGFPVETEVFEVEIGNAILMQSTGLFDRNGQEIFEGDILKSNKYITSVFYERGAYRVKLRRTPNTTVTMDLMVFIEKYKTRIVGNIYENPEFLEVKE
jgi:uncharacterized phage protein (TIGR01671 family)